MQGADDEETLEIASYHAWMNLRGQRPTHSVVRVKGLGDIHPFRDGPVFENAHTIHIDRCDKNFVYYWVNHVTFPKAINVYLNSHPCDSPVLWRWKDGETTIWLANRYANYKKRWADERDCVKVLPPEEAEPTYAPMAQASEERGRDDHQVHHHHHHHALSPSVEVVWFCCEAVLFCTHSSTVRGFRER